MDLPPATSSSPTYRPVAIDLEGDTSLLNLSSELVITPVRVDRTGRAHGIGRSSRSARSRCGRIATVVDPRLHGSAPGEWMAAARKRGVDDHYLASSKTSPNVYRNPLCRVLTPWRIGAAVHQPGVGRIAWPLVTGRVITGARLQPVDVESHQLGRTPCTASGDTYTPLKRKVPDNWPGAGRVCIDAGALHCGPSWALGIAEQRLSAEC